MPNWCWNNLEVSGDEKQLQKFVEKSLVKEEHSLVKSRLEHDNFSFEGTLPRGDRKDWYEWSIANWGTKWDACEPNINHDDIDYFSVSFESAWGPPIQWIDNIMQDFPDLSFTLEYEEPGMCFGGRLSAQYKVIWDDFHWDIDQASECCEGEVYDNDDKEFTLPERSDQELSKWVGEDKIWKTLKDIPVHHKYPDHQCGVCREECETISINVADIKPAKIKVNESK
tara:strand:+ start:21 stop:698 length:678 start_codon:yes stop_codon:yes gene_type:complete